VIILKYDIIVIGAGVGGLTAAAKLALNKRKVLVLEKIHHIGGTSHIFKRGEFIFPMGPLSFSYPKFVNQILEEIGVRENISYKKSHFQLISPNIDIVYSKPLLELQESLIERFPEEKNGLLKFFSILKKLTRTIENIYDWNPDYLIGKRRLKAKKNLEGQNRKKYNLVKKYSKISSKKLLNKYIQNSDLKRLLGSQGTYNPVMSMLHLAFMWNVMSEKGIWFPSCGIHGINELLYNVIISNGGEVKLNTPVKKIMIKDECAQGVITEEGKEYLADFIVSNADYKTTFLNMVSKKDLTQKYYNIIKENAYTGSEFCVYLGISPKSINLNKVRAQHLFYRESMEKGEIKEGDGDFKRFNNKEIEICVWSEKSGDFVPENKKSIILRVNFDYDLMKEWRLGVKKRKEGYYEYKKELAQKLIEVVENAIPGLSKNIVKMEIATPLTYQDWGKRFKGSIAGWSRNLDKVESFNRDILINTPIKNLFMAGLYASKELFLGGYPTSIYTGNLAAGYILEISN